MAASNWKGMEMETEMINSVLEIQERARVVADLLLPLPFYAMAGLVIIHAIRAILGAK